MMLLVQAQPGTDIRQIATALNTKVDPVTAIVNELEREGLAHPDERMGGRATHLRAEGLAEIQSWTTKRNRKPFRAAACRSALLNWLYEQPESEPVEGYELLGDARGYYWGIPFSEEDIEEAREFLGDQGLLRGVNTNGPRYLRPTITPAGKNCVENYDSDVAAYLNPDKGSSVNYNTNIQGSSGFQVANDSPGSSMTSTVTISSDNRQQLVLIADQIAHEISNLPANMRPAAEEALTELREATASSSGDKGRIRAALGNVATTVAIAVGTDAGRKIIELIGQGIQALGS